MSDYRFFRPAKFDLVELAGLDGLVRHTDWLRRSGALQIVNTQAALESFLPDTSRFVEQHLGASLVKALSASSAVTALQDAKAARHLLAPKLDSILAGSNMAEEMRHAVGLSEHLALVTGQLAELRRPFTFEIPISLSSQAYRLVVESTPATPAPVEADRVAYAGHDALSTAEMGLLIADGPVDEDRGSDFESYARMPERLHVRLRVALGGLHPHLVARLEGAWERLSGTGPDAASQAAHSAQELIDGTLRAAAPTDEVLAWHRRTGRAPEEVHEGRPTRLLRFEYVIRNRRDQSKAARYYLQSLTGAVSLLQEAKHGADSGGEQLIGHLLLTVEGFLGFLLVE